MYKINKLQRSVLIMPEEVIFHAPTKHELDQRMISSSIIIAEERFLVPELGYDLYEAIIAAKNVVITAGNKAAMETASSLTLAVGDILNAYELMSAPYQALWKRYLWKLTAECVMVSAYPEGFVQFGSEGALHNNPPAGLMVTSGFVTPLLTSMKWTIDKKIQDRVGPLIQSMHNYICKNKSDFSQYDKKCPDCENETNQDKSVGIAMNIYDEVDGVNGSCCEPGWQ